MNLPPNPNLSGEYPEFGQVPQSPEAADEMAAATGDPNAPPTCVDCGANLTNDPEGWLCVPCLVQQNRR